MLKRKLFLLFLLTFLAPPVFAEESAPTLNFSEEEANAEVTVIADINIRSFEIISQENNKFNLSFKVENDLEIQSNLIYGIELIKKVPEGKVIFSDSKVYLEDRLTIAKGAPLKKKIIYEAPDFLSGEYALWLKIKDESGLVLSLSSLEVTLAGTNNFVEFSHPCYLTIEGEKEKYSLIQGVDLKPEEKIFLECQAQNKSAKEVTVSPRFEIYLRDSFSSQKQIGNIAQESFTFNPQESKLIKIPLILSSQPQAYDVKTELMKVNGPGYILFSNPIFSHLVIVGKSGTINSANLDKNFYQKGETAQISYLISASADGFLDSRHGGSNLQEPILKVEMKNQSGQLCGAMEEKNPNFQNKATLNLAITQDCQNPQVLLELFDGQNKLYEKKLNVTTQIKDEPKLINLKEEIIKLPLAILLLIGGLPLLVILFLLIKRRKKSQTMKIFFLGILLSGGLLLTSEASAATIVVKGQPWLQAATGAIRTSSTWVALSNCGSWSTCAVINPTFPCISRDNPIVLRYTAVTLKGCYQDSATFTYSLSGTSFTTGQTARAYAYAHGDEMCGNGITAMGVVSPKDNNDLYEIFTSNLTEGSTTSTSANYPFNVGSVPGNFNARFYLAMEHGAYQTLTDDEDGDGAMIDPNHGESYGTGTIPYTVTAPAARTNGVCGSAATTFASSVTNWPNGQNVFCSAGTASPANPSFPAAGSSTSWQCLGSNGGSNASCTAYRTSPSVVTNGVCGSAATTFASSVTNWPNGQNVFCSAGTASPANPSFPATGSSTSWQCLGSNGGSNASCTASRTSPSGGTISCNSLCESSSGTVYGSCVSGLTCMPDSLNPQWGKLCLNAACPDENDCNCAPACVSTGCPASCSNVCSGQPCGTDCGNACYGSKACTYNPTINATCNSSGLITANWTTWDNTTTAYSHFDLRMDETSNNGPSCWYGGWYCPSTTDLEINGLRALSYPHQGVVGKYYNIWIHDRRYAPDSVNTGSTSVTCSATPAPIDCGGMYDTSNYEKCIGTQENNLLIAKNWTFVSSCTAGGGICEYKEKPVACVPGCLKTLNDCGENCGTIGKYTCISKCSNECDSDSDCNETIPCLCTGEWIEVAD